MNESATFEAYAYWSAFAIPLVLIVVVAVGRKLVDKEPFQWKYFYLGVDLTVSALATALVNLLDIIKQPIVRKEPLVTTVLFVTGCLVSFVAVLAIHQEWQDPRRSHVGQILWLGCASNIVGAFLLMGFIKLKLRGTL